MIIFKTFWRIMKRYWWIVALYVVILTSISILNLRSNSNQTTFTDEKPEITIVDKTTHQPLTNNFLNYLSQTAELVKLDKSLMRFSIKELALLFFCLKISKHRFFLVKKSLSITVPREIIQPN